MITQCPKTGRTCEVTGCDGCWKAEQAEQEPVMITPGGGAFPFAVVGEMEQAEQEPVARYYGEKLVKGSRVFELIDRNLAPDTPLYATPVRTKDLTDDEIADIRMSIVAYEPVEWGRVFARAVIAADRRKNK